MDRWPAYADMRSLTGAVGALSLANHFLPIKAGRALSLSLLIGVVQKGKAGASAAR